MSDTVLYVRDPQTAQLLPIKAIDNLDGTYSLTDAAGGDASQTTLLAVKTQTDTISAKQDGVYFDELLGSAGTALPIGTATSPVTNLADALTIMTARKLNKLYLAGTGAHAITLTDGVNIQIVGNAEYDVTIAAGATVTIDSDLLCKSFTNTTGTPTINGNLTSMTTITSTTGTITVWGNVYAGTTTTMSGAAGTLTVYGDAKLMGNVTTSNGTAVITIGGNAFFGASYTGTSGTLTIGGDCYITTNLSNSAAAVTIKGNTHVSGLVLNNTGSIQISGNLQVATGSLRGIGNGTISVDGNVFVGDITQFQAVGANLIVYGNAVLIGAVGATNAAASITIYGFADIRGAITATGTVTYRGVQPEVPININAVNGSETNFLDLEVASTHYTISDLVIKSVDPGANTVNVRLYKLVNGALTNTKTFAITTANYTTYYDMVTLFGIKTLGGDGIKITVQSTAGTYAITGSYYHRKE